MAYVAVAEVLHLAFHSAAALAVNWERRFSNVLAVEAAVVGGNAPALSS